MDIIAIGVATKLSLGFKNISENSTSDGLLFEPYNGTPIDVKLPNFHNHSNLNDILEKFTTDINGKLYFNGKEVPADGVLDINEVNEIWNEVLK